jgi:hypothetical protein
MYIQYIFIMLITYKEVYFIYNRNGSHFYPYPKLNRYKKVRYILLSTINCNKTKQQTISITDKN